MGAEGRREHPTRRRLMGAPGAGGVLGGALGPMQQQLDLPRGSG